MPVQTPPWHVSFRMQRLPLAHAVPSPAVVTVHELVPLHIRVLQGSFVQVMGVPAQVPAPSHTSSWVQSFPSLHGVPFWA